MQKTKLGGRFWLALTVFSLVGQVASLPLHELSLSRRTQSPLPPA